jgi:hypothetical protein
LREDLSAVDKKPPALPEDEPYKPADADPAAAKRSFDALIRQLRATPGQPELQDRTKTMREWSTFDRVLLAVAVLVLFALAVVYAAFW